MATREDAERLIEEAQSIKHDIEKKPGFEPLPFHEILDRLAFQVHLDWLNLEYPKDESTCTITQREYLEEKIEGACSGDLYAARVLIDLGHLDKVIDVAREISRRIEALDVSPQTNGSAELDAERCAYVSKLTNVQCRRRPHINGPHEFEN